MQATATDSAPARGSAALGPPEAVRAFASGEPLARERLLGAPVRWPRPSRLAAALRAAGQAHGGRRRGARSDTVGDLLQHLPSDSRESRTLAALRAGEQATVEVWCARSPPARCAGGGCARWSRPASPTRADRCARASSTSPGWSIAIRPARGCCCTASPTAAAASASPTTPSPAKVSCSVSPSGAAPDAGGSGTVAHYPASEGLSSTQILTLVRGARGALADFPEPLPAALRVRERAAGQAGGARRDALPPRRQHERERAGGGWPSRSCCWPAAVPAPPGAPAQPHGRAPSCASRRR